MDSARVFSSQNSLFQLFNSQRFQSNDLLFSDAAINFNLLDDRTSFTNYLGNIHWFFFSFQFIFNICFIDIFIVCSLVKIFNEVFLFDNEKKKKEKFFLFFLFIFNSI